MRVLYNGVIYNCYTVKRNEHNKTIELTAESSTGVGRCKLEIYFKNTTSMYNCFDDLLVNGYVNVDRYDAY